VLLLKHSVEGFDFDSSGQLILCLLSSRGLNIVYIRLNRGKRVAEGANATLDQILNLLWNLDLIVIIDDLMVSV
jgi:hypothetical protein